MKRKIPSVWIAVLCVFCAILTSGIYKTAKENKETNVQSVSEVFPARTASPAKTEAPKPTPSKLVPQEKTVAKAEAVPFAPAASENIFTLPSSGQETKPYSEKTLVYFPALSQWRCHLGIDYVPTDSDDVYAVSSGKIEKIFTDPLYGTTVCIDHGNGLKTYYASLSETKGNEGDAVTQGALIGRMGQTSPIEEGIHLHFYMKKDGKTINPLGAKN